MDIGHYYLKRKAELDKLKVTSSNNSSVKNRMINILSNEAIEELHQEFKNGENIWLTENRDIKTIQDFLKEL